MTKTSIQTATSKLENSGMILYKLTDQAGFTNNRTYNYAGQTTHQLPEVPEPRLCRGDVLHAYRNLNLGFLLQPIHGNIHNPRCFRIEGDVVVKNFGMVGCFRQTVLEEIPAPEWVGSEYDMRIRVQFAVLCARACYPIYAEEYPEDTIVKAAIDAAQVWIDDPTEEKAREAREAERVAKKAAGAVKAASYVILYVVIAKAAAYAAAASAPHTAKAAAMTASKVADAAYIVGTDLEINFEALADEAVRLVMERN